MDNWYADLLLDPRWLKKRKEQLAIDKYKCMSCGRSYPEVSLCVHHIGYVTGWMPWDYPSSMLQTLCLDCHNSQHLGQKPIYTACVICRKITEDKDITGRNGKHEWICEPCVQLGIEEVEA